MSPRNSLAGNLSRPYEHHSIPAPADHPISFRRTKFALCSGTKSALCCGTMLMPDSPQSSQYSTRRVQSDLGSNLNGEIASLEQLRPQHPTAQQHTVAAEALGKCAVCCEAAHLSCASCESSHYCSKRCQVHNFICSLLTH